MTNPTHQDLKASEERLQLAVEAAGMGMWQGNLDTRESLWWPGMAGLHGLPEGTPALSGGDYLKLIHPEDREHVMQVVQHAVAHQDGHNMEYRVVWPDGSVHWIEGRARMILAGHGTARILAGVCIDITQRKNTEIDNARLLRELRESDHAKDVFLATLAHELRNPLAPIWNGLAIIQRVPDEPVRVVQVAGIIERQLGQLARLVDDLLDMSRISTGKIELRMEPASLVSILGNAVEISRPHIEAAHHTLTLTFPDEPTDVLADPGRMAQVFSNLLNNAAKYTRRGGKIDVIVESQPEQMLVRVCDNGTGIPPDMLAKVFGLFAQVTQPFERRQGGLGIGLSLVDGLVRLHGGSVLARSAGLDQGSEFVVCLPRLVQAGGTALPPTALHHIAAEPAPNKRRVLVVDDNEDAATTVAALLAMFGNEVALAHDGASAVERVAQFRPDVVLLDIGLPDLNGYQVARRIRELEGVRQPLLIALTGWGQAQDREMAAQAGFDQHWTKPVDPARLQELASR